MNLRNKNVDLSNCTWESLIFLKQDSLACVPYSNFKKKSASYQFRSMQKVILLLAKHWVFKKREAEIIGLLVKESIRAGGRGERERN